jgi:hypothetical protein
MQPCHPPAAAHAAASCCLIFAGLLHCLLQQLLQRLLKLVVPAHGQQHLRQQV